MNSCQIPLLDSTFELEVNGLSLTLGLEGGWWTSALALPLKHQQKPPLVWPTKLHGIQTEIVSETIMLVKGLEHKT